MGQRCIREMLRGCRETWSFVDVSDGVLGYGTGKGGKTGRWIDGGGWVPKILG